MMTLAMYALAILALVISVLADRKKTIQALRIAATRFGKVAPTILAMLVLFAVTMGLLPESVIRDLLGQQNRWLGVGVASVIGSITLLPGFIAFPLCGMLLKEGVPYMVLAAFTTTMMTVGVVTYPLEKQYFGRNVTILRNLISLLIAMIVSAVIGIVFGEILL